jgi:hypothetical protein
MGKLLEDVDFSDYFLQGYFAIFLETDPKKKIHS